MKRIPSLDGARAFSILCVFAGHFGLTLIVPGLWRINIGNLGVRVFFVISGFIITKLLLDERERTGTVSLKAFYLRRMFRIFPAFYVFLLVMAFLGLVGVYSLSARGLWSPALYLSDYVIVGPPTQHSWSLSVEEKFYVLWPSVLLLFGLRRAGFWCCGVLIVSPLLRVLTDSMASTPYFSYYAFHCVADALAAGCLLAILRDRLWRIGAYRRLASSPLAFVPATLALVLIALLKDRGVLFDVVALPVLNVGIALTLDYLMRFPGCPFGRLLNFRPMVWLGLISYSVYLWQEPFLNAPVIGALKVVLAIACGAASYYLIEQPVLRARSRASARAVSFAAAQNSSP